MAHFAKLNENNIVLQVIVVSNDDLHNLPFPESEAVGVAFLNSIFSAATWKQTSYNNNFRFRYAGIGFTFHPECGQHGGFAAPKQYDYFIWSESACSWVPPIPYPTDDVEYYWNYIRRQWSPVTQMGPTTITIG